LSHRRRQNVIGYAGNLRDQTSNGAVVQETLDLPYSSIVHSRGRMRISSIRIFLRLVSLHLSDAHSYIESSHIPRWDPLAAPSPWRCQSISLGCIWHLQVWGERIGICRRQARVPLSWTCFTSREESIVARTVCLKAKPEKQSFNKYRHPVFGHRWQSHPLENAHRNHCAFGWVSMGLALRRCHYTVWS
jgi:hypothetical protein